MRALKTLLILTALFSFLLGSAQEACFPKKEDARGWLVYDNTGVLKAGEKEMLNRKLVRFAQESSNQIVVVLVNDLCEYTPQEFATELGHKWGVGQKEFDNGVVVLVKPTGQKGERQTFIATGYGLEGAIPDAVCAEIVNTELLPAFKKGQIYAGLDNATTVLMDLALGEYSSDAYFEQAAKKKKKAGLVRILMQLGLIAFFGLIFFGKTRRYARSNNMGFWAAMLLMNSTRGSHGGSFGNFTGGGGGFGGFGGGGFGGGGAGGSW